MTRHDPGRAWTPGPGSPVWGYLLPLLLAVPAALLVTAMIGSPFLVGGVVTAAATLVVALLARRSAASQRRRPIAR